MIRSKKRLAILLSIFLSLFSLLSLYLLVFEVIQAPDLRANPYNMRNWVDESRYARGRFLDRNGVPLIEREQQEDGSFDRYLLHPLRYSSIVGYNSHIYGKSGLEASCNQYLLNLQEDNLIAQWRNQILEAGVGSDVRLTIDDDLQALAYDLLEGHKGAIVAMNPATGDVLAMVSSPTFNANRVDEQWNELIADEQSPLLNRATQGLYTPGSVMKPITAMALLESGADLHFEDEGTLTVDGFTYANVNEEAHGTIGLREALVYSSNTYFAKKALDVGTEALEANARRFFRAVPSFGLETSDSQVTYAGGLSQNQIAAGAFGQGEMLVSPLSMCMAYSAIANGGTLRAPRLIDAVLSASGHEVTRPAAETLGRIGSPDSVQTLREDLQAVAEETDSAAQIDGAAVAGKTGTAENVSGNSHAWYCGFAPAKQPQIAVTVVLEEEGRYGSEAAAPIAGRLFDAYVKR